MFHAQTVRVMTAMMPSVGAAVDTAARPSVEAVSALWSSPFDEEEEDQRPRQEKKQLSKTCQNTPSNVRARDTVVADSWDDENAEECWDNELSQTAGTSKNASVVQADAKPVMAAQPIVEAKPVPEPQPVSRVAKTKKWQTGTVRYFSGCYGWVTSDNVRTGRTIDSQGITDAIFLHKNDCHSSCFPRDEEGNTYPLRRGMTVTFRLEPDLKGALKCVDVQREEDMRLDLDSWQATQKSRTVNKRMFKEQKDDHKTSDSSEGQKARMKATSKPQHVAQPAEATRAGPGRSNVERVKATPKLGQQVQPPKSAGARLSRNNVEFHDHNSDGYSSSTAAGSTSCSASVADVSSEFGLQDRPSMLDTQTKGACRTKSTIVSQADRWANRPWANRPSYSSASCASTASYVGFEMTEPGQSLEEDAPDSFLAANSWEDDGAEDALDKFLEAKLAIQTVDIAVHNDDMVPITSSMSDRQENREAKLEISHSTSTSQKRQQHAIQGELSHGLAAFLAELGPQFDCVFVARSLGTHSLEEILERFTELGDFESLVVAGMKPLLRNKLYRAIALERQRRASHP